MEKLINLPMVIRYLAKKKGIENIDFFNDVMVCDYGSGPFIAKWELDGMEQPTTEELIKAKDEAEAESIAKANATKYINSRIKEYPKLEEQLDMLYWDQVNGTNNWRTLIRDIKEKYPKPEEL